MAHAYAQRNYQGNLGGWSEGATRSWKVSARGCWKPELRFTDSAAAAAASTAAARSTNGDTSARWERTVLQCYSPTLLQCYKSRQYLAI